jgi:predicted ATP-grasp superfamily ATP-dependent carboligase
MTPIDPASKDTRSDSQMRHKFGGLLGRLPQGDRRSTPPPALDRGLPVLLVRLGDYPIHHATSGVIRTMGRAGVPVYVVMEPGITPASTSRYLAGQVKLVSDGEPDQATLLDRLVQVVDGLPARPLLVATDDKAAVLIAEGADALDDRAIKPAIPPDLPRQLAGKAGLHEICLRVGVPRPATVRVKSGDELEATLADFGLPAMVKENEPWSQLTRARSSTVVRTTEDVRELRTAIDNHTGWSDVVVQEFLPDEDAEDWFVHGYCTSSSEAARIFTGRKLWSWPPRAGVTAYARTESNEELELIVRDLCRSIGYCGIFDTDWRYDRRSGKYHLLDFNPRIGAQFRMFEDDDGIDVVRAMHLDLSGRPLSPATRVNGERFFVENLGIAARSYYKEDPHPPEIPGAPTRVRLAWFSRDDVRPFIIMLGQQLVASVRTRLRARRSRPSAGA